MTIHKFPDLGVEIDTGPAGPVEVADLKWEVRSLKLDLEAAELDLASARRTVELTQREVERALGIGAILGCLTTAMVLAATGALSKSE